MLHMSLLPPSSLLQFVAHFNCYRLPRWLVIFINALYLPPDATEVVTLQMPRDCSHIDPCLPNLLFNFLFKLEHLWQMCRQFHLFFCILWDVCLSFVCVCVNRPSAMLCVDQTLSPRQHHVFHLPSWLMLTSWLLESTLTRNKKAKVLKADVAKKQTVN